MTKIYTTIEIKNLYNYRIRKLYYNTLRNGYKYGLKKPVHLRAMGKKPVQLLETVACKEEIPKLLFNQGVKKTITAYDYNLNLQQPK